MTLLQCLIMLCRPSDRAAVSQRDCKLLGSGSAFWRTVAVCFGSAAENSQGLARIAVSACGADSSFETLSSTVYILTEAVQRMAWKGEVLPGAESATGSICRMLTCAEWDSRSGTRTSTTKLGSGVVRPIQPLHYRLQLDFRQ